MSQLFQGALDEDFVLDNVMLYVLTGTATSGLRLYYEQAHAGYTTEPTVVPVGLAQFANDTQPVRRFVERDHHNLVAWTRYDTGGHWAGHQVPDLLAADIDTFFDDLRPRSPRE